MCHGHTPRNRAGEFAEALEEEPDEESDGEEPSFAEDDPAEDVELITDGGDEDA